MTKINIRNATPDDFVNLPALEEDAAQAFVEFGYQDVLNMQALPVSFYKNLSSDSIILIADKNHEAVGFCVIIKIDNQAYLKEVSVAYKHSGQGFGRSLLDHAFQEAKERGYTFVTLTTFSDLPFNAPFYESLGFKKFAFDQRWPELKSLHEEEKCNALASYKRIAMIKNL